MIVCKAARMRQLSYVLGTSVAALVAASASPASAQCTPDPTVASGTTNCTGTDQNGLVVSTSSTRVNVEAGAVVQSGTAAGAITSTNFTTVTVNGLVDGQSKAGIAVVAGPPRLSPCDPYAGASIDYSCPAGSYRLANPGASISINVAEGGTVTGAQALLLSRDSRNNSGSVQATVTNAGMMTGTAGPALVNTVTTNSSMTVNNLATGMIGGMSGRIDSVTNAGRIEGGANPAIASTSESTYVTNSGKITSTSGTAILATGALTLTNTGSISGSVVSTASAGQNSVIDTRQGTIDGNLVLGAGNDTLRASFDPASGKVASVTGTIDGGVGLDTIVIGTNSDITIGGVALPSNFERLGLELSQNATVTLTSGLSAGTSINLSGYGSVINQADLTTSGAAVTGDSYPIYALSLNNQANIAATLSGTGYAVSGVTSLTNSGTITASGGAGAYASYQLDNSGTITATGTGATLSNGTFTNSGTIVSSGGMGASIAGPYYSSASNNSGIISGATTGLLLAGGLFTNSGTISGGTIGVTVAGYNTTLVNDTGGVVTGGANAITNTNGNVRVVNAGTINGNVNFVYSQYYDYSNDVFVDLGGTVNGAIKLGGGDDQLVVNLGADPARPLAGATGGVDAGAGYDTLRYLVDADASTNVALANGFEGLAYELGNSASLALTTTSPITVSVGLTGNGTVTLDGTIASTDRSVIDASIQTVSQLVYGTAGATQNLTIINNGSLSLTKTDANSYSQVAAVSAGTSNFTNNGAITVNSTSNSSNSYYYYPAYGVLNGSAVTNNGSITLTGGGTAIYGAQVVVNTGTITATGTSTQRGRGVSYFNSLDNSGTISTDGNAVEASSYNSGEITNSGLIQSSQGSGVVLGGYNSVLTNEATGTIKGGTTAVDINSGGLIVNRGTIIGNVNGGAYSYGSTTYVADGGTLEGDLTFGYGNNVFVMTGSDTGVSGTIDGSRGYNNTFGYALTSSADVSLDVSSQFIGFRNAMVQIGGADTVVTVSASNPFAGTLSVSGEGKVVNTAEIAGNVVTQTSYLGDAVPATDLYTLAAFENQGMIAGGVSGDIANFVNSGTIGSDYYSGVSLSSEGAVTFANSGTISGSSYAGVQLYSEADIAFANSGAISGSVFLNGVSATTATNSGTISSSSEYGYAALSLNLGSYYGEAGNATASLVNSGTISATAPADLPGSSVTGVLVRGDWTGGQATITNNGTISADGTSGIALLSYNTTLDVQNAGTIKGSAASIVTTGTAPVTIRNTGTLDGRVWLDAGNDRVENFGTITGAVLLEDGDDVFVEHTTGTLGGIVDGGTGNDRFVIDAISSGTLNARQLTGFEQLSQTGAGTVSYAGSFDVAVIDLQGGTLAVASGQTLATAGPVTISGGSAGVGVNNAGTISGNIALGAGADTVTNTGTIRGAVLLGAGDDMYIEGLGGLVEGGVDGGAGVDTYGVVLAGDRAGLNARSGFERLSVGGSGTLALALDQNFQSVTLSGANLTATLGGFTLGRIDGSAAAEQVVLDGDVAVVSLGAGNDGLALGATTLAGQYDGGEGFDTLRFSANGAVTLTGSAINFEAVSLAGNELTVAGTLGNAANSLTFGDEAQSLTVASGGTLAGRIDLGAGDDTLRLASGGTIAGTVSGGAGVDIATLELANAFTLSASMLTGFERLNTEGTGSLTLSGGTFVFDTVSLAGDLTIASNALLTASLVSFGARNDTLTIAGRFSGSADLGAGNDTLQVAAGGTIDGSVNGGAGTDTATFDLASAFTLSAGVLNSFEWLQTTGTGALTLAGGTFAFDTVSAAGDLTVASGTSLTASLVSFGAGDNRLTIVGSFAGSVAGGAGSDSIDVSGNATFGSISDVEALRMSAGLATISGQASLGSIALNGGRLIGLAGSTISASTIQVAQGAIFGSAGTVNGNITVAGTLSPGASPGTMTVNGNVALASTSVSVFEITSTVSDKLVINGTLSIAQGATLQIVADTAVTPGKSLDLITASGGITGSFTNVVKPASLFGFLIQRDGTITLVGQFLNDASFAAPVRSTIDYVNTVLTSGSATSAFLNAVPSLVTASGATDQAAFALLTPEAYASASQIAVDQGLELAATARSDAFAPQRATPGAFTLASALGSTRTLESGADGAAKARTNGYGFLGGLGWAGTEWSIGGFIGYLDSRQTLFGRGARTDLDGIVAGFHARWSSERGIGIKATLAYTGGKAKTHRFVPSGTANAGYDLTSWTADASVDYAVPLSADWTVRPSFGITAIRTTRDGVAEEGGSPYALTVAGKRDHAVFVDGALTFRGGMRENAVVRPYLSVGVRYQIDGRTPYALAALGGGGYGLEAAGASRASLLATATVGADVAISSRLALFSALSGEAGDADNRASIRTGLRLAF